MASFKHDKTVTEWTRNAHDSEAEIGRLQRSSEMENKNIKKRKVLWVLSQTSSLINFKTYFAVEGLINGPEHEGCSLPLLTSESSNKIFHISSFIR